MHVWYDYLYFVFIYFVCMPINTENAETKLKEINKSKYLLHIYY